MLERRKDQKRRVCGKDLFPLTKIMTFLLKHHCILLNCFVNLLNPWKLQYIETPCFYEYKVSTVFNGKHIKKNKICLKYRCKNTQSLGTHIDGKQRHSENLYPAHRHLQGQTDTPTHTDTYRDRQAHTQSHTDTYRDRHTHTITHRHLQGQTDTHTHTDTYRDRHAHCTQYTHTHLQGQTYILSLTGTDIHTSIKTLTRTVIHTRTQTLTGTDIYAQTLTGTNRHTQTILGTDRRTQTLSQTNRQTSQIYIQISEEPYRIQIKSDS